MGRAKYFILLGDTTTHGGTVVSAYGADTEMWRIHGIGVAFEGDLVYCPKCRGSYPIIEGARNPDIIMDGRRPAREGDRTGCGAQLIAVKQHSRAHFENESLAARAAEAAQPSAPVADIPAWEGAIAEQPLYAARPEREFCLECWLKALSQRNAVMPG